MPGRGLPYSSPPFSTAAYVTLSAATSASSIDTSRWAPRPVRALRVIAPRIATAACVPASTSAAWRFDVRGVGSSPCSRCMSPDTALMMCAKAGRARQGPVWPKPEIEQ